ncbi:hypothetical protein AW27_016245 [Streptomyces sp. PCS3-D2]|uniref:hypothetical protein n=1 Tax=Streptomyces sp. PCS3-D2 TaxID=1460244 RepID=UPI000B102021|nr:hypothetical protein [Streptomyces sp. PCS3-D2]WKV72953.1 hypothetical protein AW27_016245 [Streptomyces sp. PCS3-D2]
MRPDAYAALYGRWQPAQQVHVPVGRDRPGVVALAALVWAVTVLSVAWVGGLLSVALVWGRRRGSRSASCSCGSFPSRRAPSGSPRWPARPVSAG